MLGPIELIVCDDCEYLNQELDHKNHYRLRSTVVHSCKIMNKEICRQCSGESVLTPNWCPYLNNKQSEDMVSS